MLDYNEKKKIKEYLEEVLRNLNVNPRINMAYFLESIDETNSKIKSIESSIHRIEFNQRNIEHKLDIILRKLDTL